MDITLLLIVLIFLLDIAVLWNVMRSNSAQRAKVLYSLIVIFFPVIGVSIYYLIRK